jgi:CBS domain containing-hemolysin-like protein
LRNEDGRQRSKKRTDPPPRHWRWVVRIFLMSVVLSGVLSLLSGTLLTGAGYVSAILTLIFFVLLGIVFDVVGVAVTAASPSPFHSMASHRTKGAKESLFLLRNSEKVASFCNDVVGDICGIISGTAAAVIAVEAYNAVQRPSVRVIQLLLSALVAALTICGKAFCKQIALDNCTSIVHLTARIIYRVKRPFTKKQK